MTRFPIGKISQSRVAAQLSSRRPPRASLRRAEAAPQDAPPAAPPEAPLPAGLLLAERYRIEGLLTIGSACEVYRARHLLLDRAVALKLQRAVPARAAQGERARDRLLWEARVLARLKHPNVVRVHDCGVSAEGRSFLVTELLEGPTLEQVMTQPGPRLPLREACRLGGQAARALADLHALGLALGGSQGALQASHLVVEQDLLASGGERLRLVNLAAIAPTGPTGRRVLGLLDGQARSRAGVIDRDGAEGERLQRRDELALGELLFRMLTGARCASGAGLDAGAQLAGRWEQLAATQPRRERAAVVALGALLLPALSTDAPMGVSARRLEQALQQVA